ncbi:MAG: UDP-N-acetylglucosamine 1-carboxyvinyltransferase [Rickettsiales bacterium]|jgi:UDP-N-acetylglucosamine 1-carboxyvinyltransferase
MKKLLINGGKKLFGKVQIAGAKNAALPLMVASILTEESLTLSNVPHVADISTMANLLSNLGVDFNMSGMDFEDGHLGKVITFDASKLNNPEAPYDLVVKMRASILILGPLLARFGKARISLPGGCAIGTRPVDLHLKAMEKMGATIDLKNGYIEAEISGKLQGAKIHFEKQSVGATENVMMAATLAEGTTELHNAAKEPEIVDLAKCLNAMGAKVSGAGTPTITIVGVDRLHKAKHRIIGDRIEAGTYIAAAAITDGCLVLSGINVDLLHGFKDKFENSGISIKTLNHDQIEVKRSGEYITAVDISTQPYPGFPTDMQAQFMSLMCVANGTSTISENIFENRFMHVLELVRMGADIEIHGNVALVKGSQELLGAEVMATDLRASVAMVLAALIAKGQTKINRLYHLERGYERLSEKLISCGADLKVLY